MPRRLQGGRYISNHLVVEAVEHQRDGAQQGDAYLQPADFLTVNDLDDVDRVSHAVSPYAAFRCVRFIGFVNPLRLKPATVDLTSVIR
jgi:hypothetical protein